MLAAVGRFLTYGRSATSRPAAGVNTGSPYCSVPKEAISVWGRRPDDVLGKRAAAGCVDSFPAGRIDGQHVVDIQQLRAGVLDQRDERQALALDQVRTAISQHVAALLRGNLERLALTGAAFLVPAPGRHDTGLLPELALPCMGTGPVAARDEERLLRRHALQRGAGRGAITHPGRVVGGADDEEIV